MAIRTIPSRLPIVNSSEIAFGRPLTAATLRRFAQAQNFLWANVRRAHAFWAYDGEGRAISGKSLATAGSGSIVGGWQLPSIVDMPGGTYRGVCIATFAIPSPQVGNDSIKVQGRASFTRQVGTAAIRCTFHETDDDETFTGIYGTETLATTNTAWDFSITINGVPNNRPLVGKLWIGGLLGSPTSGTGGSYDDLSISALSARWLAPSELVTTGFEFEPVSPALATAGRSANVAMLDMIRRQIFALAGSRGQTEIVQSWFGETNRSNTSYGETGRYRIYVSTNVNAITVRVWIFKGAVDGALVVKWNGTAVLSFITTGQPARSVQAYEGTFNPATPDAEGTLTFESLAASEISDYGIDLLGVWAWESGIDSTGWPTIPSTYAPLDEGRLRADEILSADLEPNESARTGLTHLFKNALWLAKNRLRSLVGDWRHRTLKRIADESGVPAFVGWPGAYWDWTPGYGSGSLASGVRPRNITVRGDLVTNDGWARGAGNHDSLDGYGPRSTGWSDTGAASSSSWPSTQAYKGHGRRLSVVHCAVPAGLTMHASDATATTTFKSRARRVRPSALKAFDNGTLGPMVEEPNWQNRASLEVDWPSTGGLSLPIRSTTANVVDDHLPRWLPAASKLSYVGEGKIRGRLPIAYIPIALSNVLEGTLFEVELFALLAYEDPLSPAALALLA